MSTRQSLTKYSEGKRQENTHSTKNSVYHPQLLLLKDRGNLSLRSSGLPPTWICQETWTALPPTRMCPHLPIPHQHSGYLLYSTSLVSENRSGLRDAGNAERGGLHSCWVHRPCRNCRGKELASGRHLCQAVSKGACPPSFRAQYIPGQHICNPAHLL